MTLSMTNPASSTVVISVSVGMNILHFVTDDKYRVVAVRFGELLNEIHADLMPKSFGYFKCLQ